MSPLPPPGPWHTIVFLADRVIVMCAPSYQYNSCIIIIIFTLHYDNQFRSEVGGRLYGCWCENSVRRTRRSVTVKWPVGRKSAAFGVRECWHQHIVHSLKSLCVWILPTQSSREHHDHSNSSNINAVIVVCARKGWRQSVGRKKTVRLENEIMYFV